MEQQTLVYEHLLWPDVTSFANIEAFAYKTGFIQPRDPFPTAIRAALRLENIPARAGEDADVPESRYHDPPTKV